MTKPDDPATPTLIATTIDCNDLETMTRFWAELLGVEHAIHDHFGFLAHAPDGKVTIWLQRVDEEKVGKNRVHLDFVVDDLDAAVDRITALGGGAGELQEWRGFVWRTCTDPGTIGDTVYFEGAGTLPWGGSGLQVLSVPGTPGEIHTITFTMTANKPGPYTNCAELTSDAFQGVNVSCFSGTVLGR